MKKQNIDDVHTLVIHCSATITGFWLDAADIDKMHRHRPRPFAMIGYHWVIRLDGTHEQGRPMTRRGAHVKGKNLNTVGICMVGGLDSNGKPADTFTDVQYEGLFELLFLLKGQLPGLKRVVGHRDYSPDLNGNGLIEPEEWIKECPCFSVKERLLKWGLAQYAFI